MLIRAGQRVESLRSVMTASVAAVFFLVACSTVDELPESPPGTPPAATAEVKTDRPTTVAPAATIAPTDSAITIDLPMESVNWRTDYTVSGSYRPLPSVEFTDSVMRITVGEVASGNYPRVSVWSIDAPVVKAGDQYVMEAEARIITNDGTFDGNYLVGLNAASGNPHFFHHWHLDSDGSGDFWGDWSEEQCHTGIALDNQFHAFRLEYDGTDTLDYYFDDELMCRQNVEHDWRLDSGDSQAFRVYFEHPPGGAGATLEVRRFAVTVRPGPSPKQSRTSKILVGGSVAPYALAYTDVSPRVRD